MFSFLSPFRSSLYSLRSFAFFFFVQNYYCYYFRMLDLCKWSLLAYRAERTRERIKWLRANATRTRDERALVRMKYKIAVAACVCRSSLQELAYAINIDNIIEVRAIRRNSRFRNIYRHTHTHTYSHSYKKSPKNKKNALNSTFCVCLANFSLWQFYFHSVRARSFTCSPSILYIFFALLRLHLRRLF